MKRKDLFSVIAETIQNGEYKEIDVIGENIRVSLDKFFCVYFNKNGLIRVIATETQEHFPVQYEDVEKLSQEERQPDYIQDKLDKWEMQKAQLEGLIANAKAGKIKVKEKSKHDESLDAVKQRCREAKAAKKAGKEENAPQGHIWNRLFGNN